MKRILASLKGCWNILVVSYELDEHLNFSILTYNMNLSFQQEKKLVQQLLLSQLEIEQTSSVWHMEKSVRSKYILIVMRSLRNN